MKKQTQRKKIFIKILLGISIFLFFSILYANLELFKTAQKMHIKNNRARLPDPKIIIDIEKRISEEELEYNRTKQEIELKRRRFEILAFENSLTTAEKPALMPLVNQERGFKEWQDGQINIMDLSRVTTQAKQECEKVKRDIRFIQLPPSLSADIRLLLDQAKDQLLAAYNKKIEAFNYILDLTHNNKAINKQRFEETMSLSRQFSSDAILNIIEAKKKLDTNIAAQENYSQG